MTQRLQFPCPACGEVLVLPGAAAGVHGPCPRCGREIVGPDPENGLAALLAEADPEPCVVGPPEELPPDTGTSDPVPNAGASILDILPAAPSGPVKTEPPVGLPEEALRDAGAGPDDEETPTHSGESAPEWSEAEDFVPFDDFAAPDSELFSSEAPHPELPVSGDFPDLEEDPGASAADGAALSDAAVPDRSEDEPLPFSDFSMPSDDPPPASGQAPCREGFECRYHPSAESRGNGPLAAVLLFSCLLSAALAFIGGYFAGRTGFSESAMPAVAHSSSAADSDPAPRMPASAPADRGKLPPAHESTGQDTAPPASPPAASGGTFETISSATGPGASTPGPESILKAFLAAPGWAVRSVYVMSPAVVREAMATHAAAHGDGPIQATGMSLLQSSENSAVMLVSTSKFPGGFPVALASVGDGWLVDWETFTEFHDDMFKTFADGHGGKQGVFHLLVNRGDPKGAPEGFTHFKLNPPMPGRERISLVKNDSAAFARLREIFENQEKLDPETFRQLIAAKGLPIVLSVSLQSTEGGAGLRIEDVVAVGWNPTPAENSP